MSAKTMVGVLNNLAAQLDWTGPNGKKQGHVVLVRSDAEILLSELSAFLKLVELEELSQDEKSDSGKPIRG